MRFFGSPLRRTTVAAVSLAGVCALGGCGGSQVHDYCSALNADQHQFAAMLDGQSPTALLHDLPMLESLRSKAPSDIADDWQLLVTAVHGLKSALARAHVKPADFHHGRPPAGLPAAQRRAIADAAGQIADSATVNAANNIDQEARDVCKVNLGL